MNRLIQFKSSRWAAMLLASVVATITCVTVANATQTITTPNAAFIAYNLAAGLNSAAITPATNRSVLVMGCCTTVGGVGQVSLVHFPSNFIQWVGFDYRTAAITTGFSSTAGTHIVYLDQVGVVDIQTASADTIRIQNGSPGTRAGNVTLVW
jgi:peptidoglycan/LPS O-acetylase OafA/YrhL